MSLRDPITQRRDASQRNATTAAASDATAAISGLLRLTGLLVAKKVLLPDEALAVVTDITAHLQPLRGQAIRTEAEQAIPGLFDDG